MHVGAFLAQGLSGEVFLHTVPHLAQSLPLGDSGLTLLGNDC